MPATGDRQTLMFSATFPKEIQVQQGQYWSPVPGFQHDYTHLRFFLVIYIDPQLLGYLDILIGPHLTRPNIGQFIHISHHNLLHLTTKACNS